MNKIVCISMIALSLLMVGCENGETDLTVESTTMYINSTETVKISTYNGYRLCDNSIEEDGDEYKVTLRFKKLFK